MPTDVFEEGEKRPEKDRKRKHKRGNPGAKNGDSPASDIVSLESRKRKPDAASSDASLAKKPNISTELNGSFKRALDPEVCGLPD